MKCKVQNSDSKHILQITVKILFLFYNPIE